MSFAKSILSKCMCLFVSNLPVTGEWDRAKGSPPFMPEKKGGKAKD